MQCATPTKALVAIICGALLCCVGGILCTMLPNILKQLVLQFLVRKPAGSGGGSAKPNIAMYSYYYLFNYTNSEEFLHGWVNGTKLKVQQLGPYAYRIESESINQSFRENYTMEAWGKKLYYFAPEKSEGSESDVIVLPNVPLRMITQGVPPETREQFNSMLDFDMFSKDQFIRTTVGEILFYGFKSDIFEALQLMNMLPFPSCYFSFAGMRNNTVGKSPLAKTGADDIMNLGKVVAFGKDYNTSISAWYIEGNKTHNEKCTKIEGTDGTFHPEITKDDKLIMFMGEMCRSLKFKYEEERDHHGVLVYRFRPDASVFGDANVNPDNACFCTKKEHWCRPTGVYSLQPCMKAPLALSWPHFYMASKELVDAVDGLYPDKEKHGALFDILPMMGIPLKASIKMQSNLEVQRMPWFPSIDTLPKMYMPLYWSSDGADLNADATNFVVSKLSSMILIGSLAPLGVLILGGIIGAAGILCSIIINFKIRKENQVQPKQVITVKQQGWVSPEY